MTLINSQGWFMLIGLIIRPFHVGSRRTSSLPFFGLICMSVHTVVCEFWFIYVSQVSLITFLV